MACFPAAEEAVAIGDGDAEEGAIELKTLALELGGMNALAESGQDTAGTEDDGLGQVGEVDWVGGKTALPLVFCLLFLSRLLGCGRCIGEGLGRRINLINLDNAAVAVATKATMTAGKKFAVFSGAFDHRNVPSE